MSRSVSRPRAAAPRPTAALQIHVLALHDCTPLAPVGIVDLLRKTQLLATAPGMLHPRRAIDVTLVSPGPTTTVIAAGGLKLTCATTVPRVLRSDLVVVPPVDPDVLAHLAQNRRVVPWLRRMYDRGADLASACTGSFLLAEAGLLDGRTATTHWAFQELLRARYPGVSIEPQAILVDHGRICTAGGATSFLNLVLLLVERIFGPVVARMASKMFLVDVNKSPQGAYAMFGTQKQHADAEILQVQKIIEDELATGLSVARLASRIGMSRRNFVRRFARATGNPPRVYVQRVRVEAGKRALEGGNDSVARIAKNVGYDDPVAFRKVFARETGLNPVAYRDRYGVADRH
jgi:transcriptional regulator GlxA family with amidase domain